MHDTVIRGGTLIDGTGAPGRQADLAIDGGLVSAIGTVGPGRREIDATGLLVTPGFVDVHTHYDGQVTWDPMLTPSCWHGVTTVVMGNCGVGFAPVRPDAHDWLIGLMEGVEDIPGTALAEGMKWGWESFPEYLDVIGGMKRAIDVGAQVPHGALRAYVMGARGADGEPANAAEIAEMGRLVAEAVRAGALGFTTSRTIVHRTRDGAATPSLRADEAELLGIARALGTTGQGVLQLISDFDDVDDEFAMLRRIAATAGRPMSISVMQDDRWPDRWRQLMDLIGKARADGIAITAQVGARPIGILLGLQATLNPFSLYPAYRAIADLPLDARLARMRDPAFKAALLAERPVPAPLEIINHLLGNPAKLFPMGDPPNYAPTPDQSIAAIAAREGRTPQDVAYDMLLARDGRELLYVPLMNYTDGDLSVLEAMIQDPNARFGLGDGGAHCGAICDGSFPTTMLTLWARDRQDGPKLAIEQIVRRQTMDTARMLGLNDRGILAPGYRADINLIDFENLTAHAPEMAFDLPAGARRLVQRASGYRATLVAGEVILENGEPTGALPGRLVRGATAAPAGALAAE